MLKTIESESPSNPYQNLSQEELEQLAKVRIDSARECVKHGSKEQGVNRPESATHTLENGVSLDNR